MKKEAKNKEITIYKKDSKELVASINEEDIILQNGYEVKMVPASR